jgi:glycosyltransferase involved in cell wall biosynthesis
VNVGVVFRDLEPTSGGSSTFQRALLDGIRSAADRTRHAFHFYSVAGAPEPGLIVVPRHGLTLARYRAVTLARELCDQVGLRRPPLSTPLEKALAENDVEVVWFASWYAERCELPFVFTVLDLEHLKQPWFPEVSARGEWERRRSYFERYVPKATRVIAPGQVGADEVERFFGVPRERLLALQHPTPPFAVRAAAGDRPSRDLVDARGLGGPYLLYPAQFWPHKNHAVLFDALAHLPEYSLVCVGSDKGALHHLRKLADQIGVASRVFFLGFVEVDELLALYAHAHALAYASYFGPENLPPLEAYALGCPVIAADVPGARDQLDHAALLVPPDDAVAWVDAVRALERDELRVELVGRGRAVAASRRVDDYVKGVLEFLDDFELVRRSWARVGTPLDE